MGSFTEERGIRHPAADRVLRVADGALSLWLNNCSDSHRARSIAKLPVAARDRANGNRDQEDRKSTGFGNLCVGEGSNIPREIVYEVSVGGLDL